MDKIEVTQDDKDAAASLMSDVGLFSNVLTAKAVQAFARHRHAATAESNRLLGMACEALRPFAFAAEHAPKIGKKPHDFVLIKVEFETARATLAAIKQDPAGAGEK